MYILSEKLTCYQTICFTLSLKQTIEKKTSPRCWKSNKKTQLIIMNPQNTTIVMQMLVYLELFSFPWEHGGFRIFTESVFERALFLFCFTVKPDVLAYIDNLVILRCKLQHWIWSWSSKLQVSHGYPWKMWLFFHLSTSQ